MKQEYIEAITRKLDECEDIALLVLIFKLLCKSAEKKKTVPDGNQERSARIIKGKPLTISRNSIVTGFPSIFNKKGNFYGNNQKTGQFLSDPLL